MNKTGIEPDSREEETASLISGLCVTAITRHRQLKTRIIIALIATMILAFAVSPVLAAVWLCIVLISQVIDVIAWKPFRDEKRATPPTQREWLGVYISSIQATVIYSSFPVILWMMWGAAGKLFAVIWLCGSLLHVTMHMHHEKRTFAVAIAPHLLYMFGLPLYALATGDEPGRWGAVVLLLAAAMYVMHLAVAFREYRETSEAMRLAHKHAVEKQNAAEQANQTKSVFLANMSHEIRTPMNGILGMAAALEKGDLNETQLEQVKVLRESGDHLMIVINDLLDFSKIEANRIEFENAPFRLSEIANRVGRLHKFKAQEQGLEFFVCCNQGCDKLLIGDAHRIEQILHNLIGNAIKFTNSGSVRVNMSVPPAQSNEPMVIEVADTGIGLTKEQAVRIFDPFTQADATTTRKFGGTGLGLSIIKGLVDAMEGEIDVTSTPGKGTLFAVKLYLPAASETEIAAAGADKNAAGANASRLEVLAAEDNAVNRLVLETFLKPAGNKVTFAEDGRKAVAIFEQNEFDIVLMDISMPEMDGVEAMQRIREVELARPGNKRTPIIAISAHAMHQQIDEYLSSGFDGYVTKPVCADALKAEIQRVMAGEPGLPKSPSAAA